MQQINLRGVDLNLLVVLEALLEEASVTRAAVRLHLTQPAVSHALDRLRTLFADPLLERRGAQMGRTARAEALRAPLRNALAEVARVVEVRPPSLRELEQTVHLATADYATALLVPPLWARLRKVAPGLNLVVHDWTDAPRELERLRRGEITLLLSTLGNVPEDIEREHIGEESYVGVMAKRHPMGPRPSATRFVEYPHVLVSAIGARSTPFDRRLAERGLQRRVGVSVASFLAVPSIVANSDAIALIPRTLGEHWAPAKTLARFRPPVDPGTFSIDLAWHRRNAQDLGLGAVRRELGVVLRTMF